MFRLILLRHAISSRPSGVQDFDRPLSSDGRIQASQMQALIEDQNLIPDLTIVSTSRRTQETFELAIKPLGTAVKFESRLYEASLETILNIIKALEPQKRTVLLVGHNPGLADLATTLIGYGDRYAFARLKQDFPPCGLAVIDFTFEGWAALETKQGRLDRFLTL